MNTLLRKTLSTFLLLGIWEIAARLGNFPLILPTFIDTAKSLIESITSNDANVLNYMRETCYSLFIGFSIGALIATLLTILAVNTLFFETLLSTLTSALAPLPAVAVFPLALMWFGISYTSIIFIAAFAAVFPVAVSMIQGFHTVPHTLRNVGKNLGMSRLELTCRILIPAALPAILAGLRNGFSNGFRALVAVEMVIGAATGSGGLGWFVMSSKQNLDIPLVYAGILAIMGVGLLFEAAFHWIEEKTVRKWGMMN